MPYIITLRQEILTGNKQLAASLTVKSYRYEQGLDKVIQYKLLDGRDGLIPLNNVAGICELKES